MPKFLSNVLKLGSATLLGQIIALIVAPALSRLYSPSDFGMFQLFLSIVSIIAIISCFTYESAILLPKKDEDAANIVVLCIIIIFIVSIMTTVFFFLFSNYIEQILNAPGFSHYIILIPVAIISNSFAFVLGFWLARREEFTTIAKGNLISSISGKAISVLSGIISPSPFGLIFGTIINDATIAIVLLKKTIAELHFFHAISYSRIKELAHEYSKFPKYNAASNLASTAGVQSTPILLAFFFSPIIIGYYAMANMVINLPAKVMGNSITAVFYQKASIDKNLTGNVQYIVKTVHKRLISIGIFPFLIIMIIGIELFTFILGSQWYTAGLYAQILAPWFFVVFISGPLLTIINIFEKQSVSLLFNVFLLVSRIVVVLIGGLLGDPIISILLLSLTGIISWGWMNMYILKIAGVSVRDAIHEIIYYLLLSIMVCFPLMIAKYYEISSNLLIIIAILITIVYYLIIVHQDAQLKQGLLKLIGDIRY